MSQPSQAWDQAVSPISVELLADRADKARLERIENFRIERLRRSGRGADQLLDWSHRTGGW